MADFHYLISIKYRLMNYSTIIRVSFRKPKSDPKNNSRIHKIWKFKKIQNYCLKCFFFDIILLVKRLKGLSCPPSKEIMP